MALSTAFSIAQSFLNPSLAIAEDLSTGTDAAVTQRRIFFQTTSGTYLVESGVSTDYNAWPLADNPKSFDVLPTDYAVSVTVQWLNVGNVVLYTLTQQYALQAWNKSFFYYLQQQQSLVPAIVQDSNYFNNMVQFYATIVGADNAVEIGDDIAAAQNCINRGTEFRTNESLYF